MAFPENENPDTYIQPQTMKETEAPENDLTEPLPEQDLPNPAPTYPEPGQYPAQPQGYPAQPRSVPKKKSKALPTVGAVIGALILLFGVLGLLGAAQKPKTADASDTVYTAFSTAKDYYMDILVVDYVGTHTVEGEDREDYYLGVFIDGNGRYVYCAIRAEQDSPVYAPLDEYAQDSDMKIGDLRLQGYFDVTSVSATVGLKDSLRETIDIYDADLRNEFGSLATAVFTVEYVAGNETDYLAAMKAKSRSATFGGILFLAIGAGLFIPSLIKIRKTDRLNAEAAAQAAPYAAPQFDPQPPVPPQPAANPYAPPTEPQPENTDFGGNDSF